MVYGSLCFSLLFHFLFYRVEPSLSFFPLMSLTNGLSLFLFKEPALTLNELFYFFVCFIYFCSYPYYLFPSNFEFVCSFFSSLLPLGGRLGCLFEILFGSCSRLVSLLAFLLGLCLLYPIDLGSLCLHFFCL